MIIKLNLSLTEPHPLYKPKKNSDNRKENHISCTQV